MTAHPRRREPDAGAEPPRVTMRDVARLAGGVHPSTVSLALRNHPSISVATRQRIQKVAKAAGYHRDPLLDAFNARRTSAGRHASLPVIAFVTDFPSVRELHASPLHATLWRGAVGVAASLFHRVEPFLLGGGGLTPARLDSVLHARNIDCLIAAPANLNAAPLGLAWDRYCAVKIECLRWPVPHFTIVPDILQGARLAVRRARELGYQRIGLLLDGPGNPRTDLLRAGYLFECASSAGPHRRAPPMLQTGRKPAAVRDWIRAQQIDAILSETADLGAELAAAGLAAGREIGWATLNPAAADPAVAGIAADYERVGALAVEQVVSLSRMNERGASSSALVTQLPVVWRDGPSLPDRRKSGRPVAV